MGGLSLGPQASQQQASQQQLAMQMGLNSMLQMQGAGGSAGQMLTGQQPHVPGLPHQGGHMDLLHQQQAQQEMLLLRQQHLAHQMGMAGVPQVTVGAPWLLFCIWCTLSAVYMVHPGCCSAWWCALPAWSARCTLSCWSACRREKPAPCFCQAPAAEHVVPSGQAGAVACTGCVVRW